MKGTPIDPINKVRTPNTNIGAKSLYAQTVVIVKIWSEKNQFLIPSIEFQYIETPLYANPQHCTSYLNDWKIKKLISTSEK